MQEMNDYQPLNLLCGEQVQVTNTRPGKITSIPEIIFTSNKFDSDDVLEAEIVSFVDVKSLLHPESISSATKCNVEVTKCNVEVTKSTSAVATSDIKDVDVLCGRGKLSKSHVGNKKFLEIIKSYREAYQNAPCRDDKTYLCKQIVSMIRSRGGRILKWNDDTSEWEPQDDVVARDKVSHALRSGNYKDPTIKRKPQSRGCIRRSEPTQRENELFEQALAAQQRIYQQLLQEDKPVKGGKSVNPP